MGEPTPDPWPEFDDDKWYKCTCLCYEWAIPLFTCSGAPVPPHSGCERGDRINVWIRNDFQCTGFMLIDAGPFMDQRLVSVSGPYDDEATCKLTL